MNGPISQDISTPDLTTSPQPLTPDANTTTAPTITTATTTSMTTTQPIDHHQSPSQSHRHPKKSFLSTLPPEIHLLIIHHLPYPDALSLKLTSSHFHTLVSSTLTVVTRVTWLLSRAQQGLRIPKSNALKLHPDAAFVGNVEVRSILHERVTHRECALAWRAFVDERQQLQQQHQHQHQNQGQHQQRRGGGEELVRGRRKWPGCLVLPGVRACEKGMRVLDDMGFGLERRTRIRRRTGGGDGGGDDGQEDEDDEDGDGGASLDVATRPRSLQRSSRWRNLELQQLRRRRNGGGGDDGRWMYGSSSSMSGVGLGCFLFGLAVLFGFLSVGLGGQWEYVFAGSI